MKHFSLQYKAKTSEYGQIRKVTGIYFLTNQRLISLCA